MRALITPGLCLCLLAFASPGSAQNSPSALVEGVWAYTGLTPRGRKEFPLTGLFVFHDGRFAQQAINDGEPLASQGGQGHFGSTRDAGSAIELTAEVAVGTSPARTPPLSLRFGTEHQIIPSVEGDALTLTFGSGTVQKFRRAGRGEGTVHSLDKGGLALVDGHFVLVATRQGKVWTGSGRYRRAGTELTLEASRWFTADEKGVTNARDKTLRVELDATSLRLEDGTTFAVLRGGGQQVRTLATSTVLSTAPAASAQEPPAIQWDHTHTYAEAVQYLNGAVKAFPKLTQLHTIGKSYLGKGLLVLEITNQATGPGRDKPGYWVDGCLHAGEVAGGEIALHTIHHLLTQYGTDPFVTELVDTRAFYIMPKLNPDGSDHYITRPDGLRSVVRPFDDDEDGRLDEDPAEDLDGDGYITVMRVKDPEGPMKTSPDDPRLMAPLAQGGDPAGWKGEWRVYTEGIDNDGDGRFNEDGVGGIDINRNFPENWKPDPISTNPGPYPLSEPESRAVVDLHLTLDNLSGAINYHMAGNVAVHPPSNLQLDPLTGDVVRQPFEDEQTYKRLGAKAVELINHVKVQVFKIHGASPASWHGSIWGVLADWWYYRRGIFGWIHEVGINPGAKEIFPSSGREIDRLRWSDENLGGKLFKPWTAFNHPALGPVEIGGFINKLYDPKYKTYTNVMLLPGPDYQKLLDGHTRWILYLASQSPLVRVTDAQARQEGSEFKITAQVRNVGPLPTNVTQQAVESKIAKTVKARLTLQGASLVGGSETIDLGHLPGNASNATRRLEWRVKPLAAGEATATVEVVSEKGGKHARALQLAR